MEDSKALPRRKFLQTGAALLYAASVPGVVQAAPALHTPKNLRALRNSLHGRLILPGEMGYAMAAAPNNARYADILPRAVAMCADAHDVQLCLRWAADHREKFAVRSGGHNYAGFSTTTGLLIDVKAMNKVWYDLAKNRGYILAGASNQDMANTFSGTDFAIPSGRCPTVGASGLVLGGGWGFSATHAGLTCDSLVQTDVVLANGQQVSADAQGPHRDLFWALRGGGGGNFGINTAFSFELHEVKDDVTIFNIVWPGQQQIELLTLLQEIQSNHATQISTRTKAYPDAPGPFPRREQLRVTTLGQFFGPKDKALEALAPALKLVKPLQSDIRQMRYWQARDYLITDDPNGMYDLRSSYVAEALPPQALETMLRYMMKWPGGSLLPENMGILFAIGGKVRDVAADATAYVHRNANYIFEMECAWAPIDKPDVVRRQQEWLTEYFAAMQPYMLPQSYVNFPSRELPNWARAYYGSNLERLKHVKRQYDPSNLFSFEQSIPRA
ncbi:FAD-binding oxidoreductase [Herbaspirillum seropedicae]|uniref:Oxidoreductase, oxygen dependent, FAD-dependent protein n=1 Tax=Herbaspirillum seropedicae (strain SmR1) TaxID=757424 RepID=D8IZD2_HERSS|nr:FAD-binding oxidoreductase [Herbaspirillum seropedicae]ADJ62252.1 oxidoreductase, oxygen dependent, FAD-dependent protein [Herbaspirillum seropedicae SmR1]AKN64413.1 oxidoreductase [Herbaspirillum seropedicae]AON53040.1 oxidoreductase, oxygen dependent, FAD-dependent protein [Herbaspirillum seropedicae]MDR6396926.1 hypothetical protein [Herbaspirillum seropedicae]NQE27717.1 oxidoreductase [Herbaspirillum seropedicae]